MFEQLNRKVFCRFVSFVVITLFVFTGIAGADVASVSHLRSQSAERKGVSKDLGQEIKSSGTGVMRDGGVQVPLRKSSNFKIGYEPVNPNLIEDDYAVKSSVLTAVTLTDENLRGAALGLDKKKDKDAISKIKDQADGQAKRIYEKIVKENNVILVVRVSEGIGRDELAESLKANDVVVPDELIGELALISQAIEAGATKYTSKTGNTFNIKNAIIDVVEGTNSFVTNVDGKKLSDLKKSESGGTSVIAHSDGKLLGNCPDIYTDGIFTMVPKDKRQEFINTPLDPETIAKDPRKIEDMLLRIAEANGIKVNDIEVVVMDRTREIQKLGVLIELQKKYSGLEFTTIKDGTVAHSLVATLGKKGEKHKVVMTVGGAPEGFLNTAVAGLFREEGALASIRVYSKNVNKVKARDSVLEGLLPRVKDLLTSLKMDVENINKAKVETDALDLNNRYAFDDAEKAELRNLRPEDAEAIISGNRLITQEDVQGDVDGSFSFITNNGVFGVNGVEKTDGKNKVTILRVGKVNGKPSAWLSEKIIDLKDTSKNFIDSVPSDQPLLNFADTKAVNDALAGVVEVTTSGVKIINEAELRDTVIDRLVYDATFNPNQEVVKSIRKLIKDIAVAQGSPLSSVYNLYVQKAVDPRQYTYPAVNIRGMAYNTARAMYSAAVSNGVEYVIAEIAKSEIGYSGQRPAEYVTSILAAAIKEGYKRPIYIQGDHFQIALKDYTEDKGKALDAARKLIREAIEAGFYQIDIDASPLVDWSKATYEEQQKDNYEVSAILTAYVRELEREFGLDKAGIVVNTGVEIGEIGKGLEKGKERNSNVADLVAFDNGYKAMLKQLGEKAGYEIIPATKMAVQTGTKHGGTRDSQGNIVKAKVSFNTLAEVGKAARERGYAGVVQHGASTLDPLFFVVFAGKPIPDGFGISDDLLNEANKEVLSENPVSEVHLATAYQDTALDHLAFPAELLAKMRKFIDEKFPAKAGEDSNKAFIENRKNVWGTFKVQLWNLATNIQDAIRQSLTAQFSTVFKNLGVSTVKDTYLQSLDKKVVDAFTNVKYTNFVNTLKAVKGENKGALVIGAQTILENAGAVPSLKRIKDSQVGIKIAVWAEDEATVQKLKVMGVDKIADILTAHGVADALNRLSKDGVVKANMVLINAPGDIAKIKDAIKAQKLVESALADAKSINVKTPTAAEKQAGVNTMPLVVARAVTGILQNEQAVVSEYKDLSQEYVKNSQISAADLTKLNDLNAAITEMPLVKATEEVAQAQLTYTETVNKI